MISKLFYFFSSFHNYLGSLDEIKNKNWLAEYERQKRSLTPRLFINEYSDIRLSDLVVKSTLGVGGFGRVELVTLRSDPEKSFALKKLKKKVMVEQQQQEHVLNEKNIMQACSSPFICKYEISIIKQKLKNKLFKIFKIWSLQIVSYLQRQQTRVLLDGSLSRRRCLDSLAEETVF